MRHRGQAAMASRGRRDEQGTETTAHENNVNDRSVAAHSVALEIIGGGRRLRDTVSPRAAILTHHSHP